LGRGVMARLPRDGLHSQCRKCFRRNILLCCERLGLEQRDEQGKGVAASARNDDQRSASHTPVADERFNFRGVTSGLNGPVVTATGTADLCFSNVGLSIAVSASFVGRSKFTYGLVIFSSTNDIATTLLPTFAAAHNAMWVDAGSGESFSTSIGCFK
jgi:hypothetical protein